MFSATMLLTALVLMYGCQKDEQKDEAAINKDNTTFKAFKPSAEISLTNGMLVFETQEDLYATIAEMNSVNRQSLDLWEKQLGIQTPASIFNAVINAEDSISNYYESLPESEQSFWRNQQPIHSEIYLQALEKGIIHLVPDGESGVYFELNLFDKSMASLVNIDGLVVAEGQIYKFMPNSVKVITDGDVEKIEMLISTNNLNDNDNIIVFEHSKDEGQNDLKSVDPGYNWTQDQGWKSTGSRTRVKVWIDGHSEAYLGAIFSHCAQFLQVTYTVRAQAQKKNFWGNWVYSNDYWPSLTFYAEWSYNYRSYACDPYITSGCGIYHCEYSYVPPSGSQQAPCNYSIPSYNNAFINLHPHGIWSSSPKYFSHAFKTQNGYLNAVADGKTFTYNWHIW
jgi:hypothetical protein